MPLSPSSEEVAPERATHVRYVVVAVATLMSLLLYLDRFCFSFAQNYVAEDLRLSDGQIAWLHSSFFWAYALAQVPSGQLADRFGPRLMLVVYILGWSLLTGFQGLAFSFLFFLMCRFGTGAAQAGAYPSAGTLLSRWVPPSVRGNASAFVVFGGRAGSAIVHPLTAILIISFVPMSTPVDFTLRDLLKPRELCVALAKAGSASPGASPAARRVWSLLSPEGREFVESMAGAAAAGDAAPMSEEDRTRLLAIVNPLLDDANLYDAKSFAALNPVEEAKWTLKKINAGESVPPAEMRRFNRFVLEDSFKAELGKLYNRAWRPVMFVYGFSGILVAGIFWFYFRDFPSQHPGCNAAERAIIAEGRTDTASVPAAKPPFPWVPILTNFAMWGMCLLQFGTNVSWLFLMTYLPTYLLEVHNVPILERSLMTMVPTWAGMVALLLGGRLTDFLVRKIGLLWGRRLPMVGTRLLSGVGYALVLVLAHLPKDSPLQTPWVYVAALSLVSFGVDLGIASVWAFMQDVGGRNVGAILGWGNMWGNLGAAVGPLLYTLALKSWSFGQQTGPKDWNALFTLGLVACLVSACGALVVDATKTFDEEPAPAE